MQRWCVPVRPQAAMVVLACGLAAASSAFAGDVPIEVTWVGGEGANLEWGNALNWNPPVVPNNNGSTTYRVLFPDGLSPTINVGSPRTITDMIVPAGARINLRDSSLTVLDRAELAGRINCNGTSFTAIGPGSAFVGPRASLITNASLGRINFGGTTLNSSAYNSSLGLTLLDARSGCRIDLPNLTSIDANFLPAPNTLSTTHNILAGINGSISMPSLQTMRGAQRPIDALDISIETGATFHAPVLHEISGGFTNIRIMGDVSLPSLSRLNHSRLRIENSATSLPALTNFDNCEISVAASAQFQTLPASMATTGLTQPNVTSGTTLYNILSSRDGGTMLDARSIEVIDAGFNDNRPNSTTTHQIRTQTGGQLDLSNLHTAIGPEDGADSLTFSLTSPSFPAPVLTGLTQTSGHVKFEVQRTYTLPSLVHATGANFIVTDGGRLSMPSLQTHDFARFDYQDGASFESVAESWPLRNFGRDAIVGRAIDPGTVLDFSSVRTIDDSAHTEFGFNKIFSGNQAVLDFSGLETIIAPSGPNSTLVFELASETRFGRLVLPTNVELRPIGGPISIAGDLVITPGARYTGSSAVANVSIAGSLEIMNTNGVYGFFRKTDLHMVGLAPATLEAASRDDGLVSNPMGSFVFGALTLGSSDSSAYVRLVDFHDNSEGALREALYLRGTVDATPTTLTLLGGSTFEIGAISTYAKINGTWTELHSLFPPGVDLIPYQGGFIFIPAPGTLIGLVAALGVSGARRRRVSG